MKLSHCGSGGAAGKDQFSFRLSIMIGKLISEKTMDRESIEPHPLLAESAVSPSDVAPSRSIRRGKSRDREGRDGSQECSRRSSPHREANPIPCSTGTDGGTKRRGGGDRAKKASRKEGLSSVGRSLALILTVTFTGFFKLPAFLGVLFAEYAVDQHPRAADNRGDGDE